VGCCDPAVLRTPNPVTPMMTDEEIREILTRMADSMDRWNILHAQADRAKLMAEVERLRKRLSTCKFCGQEVAEGLGGHTSRCYERALAERKGVPVIRVDTNGVERIKTCACAENCFCDWPTKAEWLEVVESTPHGKDGQPFYDAYEALDPRRHR